MLDSLIGTLQEGTLFCFLFFFSDSFFYSKLDLFVFRKLSEKEAQELTCGDQSVVSDEKMKEQEKMAHLYK